MKNVKFDVDLRKGKIAEGFTERLLRGYGLTIEVKRDFKVSETGNVAIEFEFRGMPSGIAATEAGWWVIWLAGSEFNDRRAIVIETNTLRRIAETCQWVTGGDGNEAKHYLVPVGKLLVPESKIAGGEDGLAKDRRWLKQQRRLW